MRLKSARLLPTVLLWVLPPSIALLGAIWLYTFEVTQSTAQSELQARLVRDNQHGAARISRNLEVLLQATDALARNDLIINALVDVAGRDRYLPTFFQSLRLPGHDRARIGFVDYRGRVLASNADDPDNYATAAWLADVMAGRPYYGFIGKGLVIAAPVRFQGQAEGAIVVEYDSAQINEIIDVKTVASAGAVLLDDGRILHSNPPEFARQGIGGGTRAGDWLSVHSSVPGHPEITIWTAEPRAEALAAVTRSRHFTIGAIILSLLAVTGGIVAAAWLAVRPLQRLIGDLRHIRSARVLGHRVTPFGTAEFRLLGRSFNRLLDEIEATTTSRDEFARETARRQMAMTELNKFRDVLDRTQDMILMIDVDTLRLRYVNHGLAAATGYANHELMDRPAHLLGADLSEQQFRAFLQPLLSGRTGVLQHEAVLKGKDGRRIPVEAMIQLVATGQQRVLVAIVRDISERKGAEQALLASQSHAKAVLDTAVDAIITIDRRGIIERVNPSTERMFGYAEAELVGRNVAMLMPEPYRGEHDGYIAHYLQTGDRRVIGVGREVTGQRRDGSTFPMELAVSEIRLDDQLFFTGMIRDITERKKIDKMKSEFISTVSHELRTPLTSIIGALGLIRGGAAGELDEKIRGMLTIAANNAERLVRLINDILDIEKIDSGAMKFEREPIDMCRLVEEAVEANRPFADQYGVRLRLLRTDDDATVIGDSDRLLQVMANLISNAAKFSPAGDDVVVALSVDNGQIRVQVDDHGPGIAEAFRDRIFSRFAQADSSDTRQKGGTGLGLSICKAIVEQHHGRIGYRTAVGKGTTFFFELPQRQITVTAESRPALRIDGGTVLICEDDPDIARLIAMMLEEDGFETEIASSARAAREKLAAGTYAGLTLDLNLPDGDGFSVLRHLRKNPHTQDLPVIIVSAEPQQEQQSLEGQALGLVDWLSKPIDQMRLLRAVRSVLRSGAGQPRILHVEDDPDIAEVISAVLGNIAEVRTAPSLADARRQLGRHRFDLVILDLMLPDGSGENLIPELENGVAPVPPVIIFSAQEASEEVSHRVGMALVKSRASNEHLAEIVRRQIGLMPDTPSAPALDEDQREYG